MDERTSTKEVAATHGPDSFSFQRISFADKLVLNVLVNGVVDTTFDIPVSTKATVNRNLSDEESLGVEPVVLVGDPQNLKLQVVASQIGKLVLQTQEPRNVILSICSRWFGPGAEAGKDDFEKLMFVLQNVKAVLQ